MIIYQDNHVWKHVAGISKLGVTLMAVVTVTEEETLTSASIYFCSWREGDCRVRYKTPRSVWNFSPDRNHILRFGVYKVDGFLDLVGVV